VSNLQTQATAANEYHDRLDAIVTSMTVIDSWKYRVTDLENEMKCLIPAVKANTAAIAEL